MAAQPILINVIVDKTGSMGPKQTDVIGGFNRFIEEQRTVPGRVRMIVTQFNSEVTPPTPAVPVEEVLPLTRDTYTPGGNTALFDAIAQTVGRADAEQRPNERVRCLIITDGEENASRETTLGQVKAVIREREARGDWTFAYLGAAPDRWTRDTGMLSGSVVGFRMAEPQASFRLASDATRRLRVSLRQSTRSFFAADDPLTPTRSTATGVKALRAQVHRLEPPEDPLDQLALPLTEDVAGLLGGAPIERTGETPPRARSNGRTYRR